MQFYKHGRAKMKSNTVHYLDSKIALKEAIYVANSIAIDGESLDKDDLGVAIQVLGKMLSKAYYGLDAIEGIFIKNTPNNPEKSKSDLFIDITDGVCNASNEVKKTRQIASLFFSQYTSVEDVRNPAHVTMRVIFDYLIKIDNSLDKIVKQIN